MKKILLTSFVLTACLFRINAQNTIPTTTCTGALKINDSLNVNRDIMANGDITSRGEVVSADTMRAQKDVIVDGNTNYK
jgi:outer membrane lipopolysaccharide assembly protein LptE/RlpB